MSFVSFVEKSFLGIFENEFLLWLECVDEEDLARTGVLCRTE